VTLLSLSLPFGTLLNTLRILTHDILEVLDARFGNTATLIASQVPVSDWNLRIPDPTLADSTLNRLQDRAEVIILCGASYRAQSRVRLKEEVTVTPA
jgi:hypothetical protein